MQQPAYYLFGLVALASALVWWQAVLRMVRSEPPLPFRERSDVSLDLVSALAVLLTWLAVPFAAREAIGVTADSPPLRNAQALCLGGAVTLLLVGAILFVGGRYKPLDVGMDLSRWRSDLRDGLLGYLAAFLPVAVVLWATETFRSEETLHPYIQMLRKSPEPELVLWIVLAVVIVAPVVEELVFRVVLQGALETRVDPWRAVVAVALFFSLVHDWPDSLPLIPLALVLGYVYYRRRSYLAVVVLHAIFNAMNLLFALLIPPE